MASAAMIRSDHPGGKGLTSIPRVSREPTGHETQNEVTLPALRPPASDFDWVLRSRSERRRRSWTRRRIWTNRLVLSLNAGLVVVGVELAGSLGGVLDVAGALGVVSQIATLSAIQLRQLTGLAPARSTPAEIPAATQSGPSRSRKPTARQRIN